LARKWVVHCKRERYDVYIGRPGPWGNPFRIGPDGTREEVIAKYKEMVMGNKQLQERIRRELRGKVLGCFCSPHPCHGDILSEIANSPST
jgi:hypothetical protein